MLLAVKAGLVADIVIIVLTIIAVVVGGKRGFLRSVLRYASTFVALAVAYWVAGPITNFLDTNFDLINVIAGWNIPLIKPGTFLTVVVGIIIFVVVRLVLVLVDRLLHKLKEKLAVVNVIDRILGMVFGLFVAIVELGTIFIVIDALSLQTVLQLTPECGGYLAPSIFAFFQENVFPLFNAAFSAAADALPKI